MNYSDEIKGLESIVNQMIEDSYVSTDGSPGSVTQDSDLTYDHIQKMAAMMAEEQDPYSNAKRRMDTQLEKKGLPCMEDILEVFYEARPEYKL